MMENDRGFWGRSSGRAVSHGASSLVRSSNDSIEACCSDKWGSLGAGAVGPNPSSVMGMLGRRKVENGSAGGAVSPKDGRLLQALRVCVAAVCLCRRAATGLNIGVVIQDDYFFWTFARNQHIFLVSAISWKYEAPARARYMQCCMQQEDFGNG